MVMVAWDRIKNVTRSTLFYQHRHHKVIPLHLQTNKKWKSDRTQYDFPVLAGCFGLSSLTFSSFSPCLVPFVSVSGKCVWLSKAIGFGGVRCALKGTTDSKLYFSTELLGHYHGAWSEQCLLVFRGRQLESSLIGTISTSMLQRGYNRVMDHLSGNQSMQLRWTVWPVSIGVEYVKGMFMACFCANVQLCDISHLKIIF